MFRKRRKVAILLSTLPHDKSTSGGGELKAKRINFYNKKNYGADKMNQML